VDLGNFQHQQYISLYYNSIFTKRGLGGSSCMYLEQQHFKLGGESEYAYGMKTCYELYMYHINESGALFVVDSENEHKRSKRLDDGQFYFVI